jgi:hypothetical protein
VQAFELQGVSKVGEASANAMFCILQLFVTLDMAAPEAVPVMRLLEGMSSTLRFVLVSSLHSHVFDPMLTRKATVLAGQFKITHKGCGNDLERGSLPIMRAGVWKAGRRRLCAHALLRPCVGCARVSELS